MKIKKSYIYLIFLPVFFNQVINLLNNIEFLNVRLDNIISLVSTFLFFSFLYTVGKTIKDTFSFSTTSFSIIFYLFSFFIVDSIVLFFTKTFLFSEIFLLVNTIWIFTILYKSKKVLLTVFPFIIYFLLNIYNNFYFNTFSKNENLLGDVEAIFFPHTKAIYDSSYYFSMTNPAASGYPQFLSYIDALLFKLSFNGEFYTYMIQASNVFIFLTFLFFFEVRFSTLSKFLSSLLFLSLVSNSEWLKFLFSNSLMSERIVSFTFAVLLYSLFQKSNSNIKFLEFFLFGMLIFSKQFTSTVALIILILMIGSFKYRRYILIGFIPLAMRELGFLTYFSELEKDHHIRQIDVKDTIVDLLLFRDLDFSNIYKIFKNLFIDKPLFYLIIVILFLILINIKNQYYKKLDFQIYLFSLLLNIILILLLYISAWKNMELESPIRYILNMLHLKIVVVFLLVDRFKQ